MVLNIGHSVQPLSITLSHHVATIHSLGLFTELLVPSHVSGVEEHGATAEAFKPENEEG